jgi:hypothetical protein
MPAQKWYSSAGGALGGSPVFAVGRLLNSGEKDHFRAGYGYLVLNVGGQPFAKSQAPTANSPTDPAPPLAMRGIEQLKMLL